MKRKPLTRHQIRQLLKRQDGKCATVNCGVVLVLGPEYQHVNWIDEHDIPLSRGGTNAIKNRSLRCIACARKKTDRPKSGGIGGDLFEARKMVRMAKMRVSKRAPHRRKKAKKGTYKWPPARKMQSRPFQTRSAKL